MGRKTSKSAVFLGFLLSIGVLIIAFFLYHMVTRPPERPVPHIEEQVIVLPVEEVRVEPSPIAAEEPAVIEPETAAAPPVVFTEELPSEPISVAIGEDVGAEPPAVIEKEPASVLIVEETVPEPLSEEPMIPEEEPSGYPFGIVPIIKSDDGSTSFDLVIVHTNDVKGNIYTENGGLGLARLSTLMKMGRGYSDNLLFLNTGDVGSIAPEHEEIAALVVDEMGYDAYLPFEIQGTKNARSLAINALDEEGYFVVQPYQLYIYNGFVVGVVGVVGPKDVPNVTFDSDLVLENARHAVDLAHTFVDYLIILTDLGDGPFSSVDLAESIDGIDLIIDGNGGETVLDVNNTLIVRGKEQLRSIGGLVLTIVDREVMLTQLLTFGAEDLLNPSASEILQAYGEMAEHYGTTLPEEIDEDPEIVALIGPSPEEPMIPEEEPSGYPFGIVPIIKSDDGSTSFDLVIVHTNDVKGNIYTENGGLGLARLSTLMKMGRGYSDNLLFLNTGDVGSIAPEHEEIAALVVDEMGYDAYLPFEIQGTKNARSLAINALDEEGYFVVQPYQLYIYNGFVVGVVGVVGPKDVPNVTFDSDLVLENARHAVDLAHTFVDYLIVLTDLGDGPFSSVDLAESIDGIDLIIDGNGGETVLDVNNTLIVRGKEQLRSIGGLVLTIVDREVMLTQLLTFGAEDLLNPSASEILQAYGEMAEHYGTTLPEEIDEDPEIVALIGTLVEEPPVEEFVGPPPPPYVFDPLVFTEEEYDFFYPTAPEPLPADDDFWADFFVVGEDSAVAYDDGTYYFRLFVNEDLVGTIEIVFEGEERLVNVEDLQFYVAEHLTMAARIRIFSDLGSHVTPEELERRGVETVYDEQAFVLYLTFSIQDMPERILSLSSATVNRREQYAISGAIPLKPRWFSLAANLNLFGQLEYPDDFSKFNRTLLNLSVSNRASLFGVALNYNFTLSHQEPYYNPGSWNGYYDFVDASIRLSFGNIGSGLGKILGAQSSIGISLEKNYAFGTTGAKRTQIEETLTIVEESDVEIFLNDKSFYTRRLKPGVYRLRDFILVQGANRIRIEVTPTSTGKPEKPIYLNFGYDYRLLAKGDTTYAIGLSMPQSRGPNKEGSFALLWLGGDYLSYHPKAFTATYRQELGVTDALTTSIDLAFTPGTLQASLGIVFATMIGSTQIQGSAHVETDTWKASYNVNLGQRFGLSETSFLNRLGLSGNYNRPVDSKGSASVSLSYSDSLFNLLRYSLSGSGAYTFDTALATWSVSASTGFSPFKGFSINGSISLTGSSNTSKPILTGQISGSYSISSKASMSNTNSIQATGVNSNLSMSLRPSKDDSITLSYSGVRTEFDGSPPKFGAGVLAGSWNHSGTFSSLNLRHQYSLAQKNMTTTVMINTALAYAGGAFGLGRSVSDSFLLVKPTGLLKRGQVSVARSLDSSPTYLPRPFGSALYNGLSTNTTNTVAVFSSGPTEFSTGSSFVYSLSPRGRESFVVRISMQPAFTVSGVLIQKDGTPYIQYSSPIYRITTNEEGEEKHDRDDTLYLFTDQDGRFILNEVKAGSYLFDLKVDDDWYGVRFDVPEQDAKTMGINTILLLESYQVDDPAFEGRVSYFDKVAVLLEAQIEDAFHVEVADEYDARLTLNVIEQTDEESFWNAIFPSFDEDPFFGFDDGFVTDDDFYFDPLVFDEMIGDWESPPTEQTVTTAAP